MGFSGHVWYFYVSMKSSFVEFVGCGLVLVFGFCLFGVFVVFFKKKILQHLQGVREEVSAQFR